MERSRKFCRLFWAKRASREFDVNYGLFGGKEKLVTEIFWGAPGVGAPFDEVAWDPFNQKVLLSRADGDAKTNMKLVNKSDVSYMYWMSVIRKFASPEKHSNDLGGFLFEHSQVAGVTLGGTGCKREVAISAERIFGFASLKGDVKQNSIAINLRDFLMEKYQKRELHQDFLSIWDQVKDGTYQHED